ncbi:hypothetical protein MGG_15938 [Pyricularia oryzae 70-15]|uniref:Uncharacterized protein n=1 Tax=Pyricularia oryzae (strain 70-15 / ATCC MYA-4617 / FGSC 8958) TaxID=242507 RepID=G4MWR5_PYRO7|nr:uncharacterized protein MGG_15938 [Pyricularia oryzae 70-15]EHA55919.1 hypothetical protein MGG_15938 [Pyricularia oryzae 70-15]
MILKQDAGLVAPASGLFLRPQRPSQRWPCSRKNYAAMDDFPGAVDPRFPFHLFRILTYMTDDLLHLFFLLSITSPPSEATMLARRPVSESLHAMTGWASNVASSQ